MGDYILKHVTSEEIVVLKRNATYTFGRDPGNDIVRTCPLVSRSHCIFIVDNTNVKVFDLGSSNGVFINGEKIKPSKPYLLRVYDSIGIGWEDLDDVKPDHFVYKLYSRKFYEAQQKRKLEKENGVPNKIPKLDSADGPEIIEIEDDPPNPSPQVSTSTSNVSHAKLFKSTKKSVNSQPNDEDDMDIKIVECWLSGSRTSTSSVNEQSETHNGESSSTLSTTGQLNSVKREISQSMEEEGVVSSSGVTDSNAIKREELADDIDVFADDSPSPQPSTSGVKQEPDWNIMMGHYSQMELICLSDDEDENFVPPSQLFDEQKPCIKSINDNFNRGQVKQEDEEAEEALDIVDDRYNGYDDPPLIELSDDDDYVDEPDENTKVWLHKLLGSQLQRSQEMNVRASEDTEARSPEPMVTIYKDIAKEVEKELREIGWRETEDIDKGFVAVEPKNEPEDVNDTVAPAMSTLTEAQSDKKLNQVINFDTYQQFMGQRLNEMTTKEDRDDIDRSDSTSCQLSKQGLIVDIPNKCHTEDLDKVKSKCIKQELKESLDNSIRESTELIDKITDKHSHKTDLKSKKKTSRDDSTDKPCNETDTLKANLLNNLDNNELNYNLEINAAKDPEPEPESEPEPYRESLSAKWIKSKKEKKILQIDPPHLLRGERRGVSMNIVSNEPGPSYAESSDDDDFFFAKKKTAKDKATSDEDKKKKNKRVKNKPKEPVPKITPPLTNEEKKERKQARSERLKKIAESQKTENNSTVKRTNKPRAKVSLTNRGDFLIPKDIGDCQEELKSTSDSEEVTEQLIMPKSQELRQNTAAEDLYDVISSSSATVPESKWKKATKMKESKDRSKSIKESIQNEKENKSKEMSSDKAPIKKGQKPTIQSDIKLKDISIKLVNISDKRHIGRVGNTILKPKKKVRFNDRPTVVVFFIEEGNTLTKCVGKDACIVKKKKNVNNDVAMKPSDCPTFEAFLLKIFEWKPQWINEQQGRSTPPPIVNKNDLAPVAMTYSSYNDYYKVMSTLMLMETWYIMSKDYETAESHNKRPVLPSSVVESSIIQTRVGSMTNQMVTTFMLEAVVNEQAARRQAHPVYGDMVMLELAGLHEGKLNFIHVFAYVISVHLTPITPTTRCNPALKNHIQNPHTLLTYEMMTRTLPISIQSHKPRRLKTVTYLRSNLRLVQAMQYLPRSPLLQLILHPTPELCQLPEVPSYESYSLVTNDKLNKKQLESVVKITNAVVNQLPGVCLIQGPPGTGKSKVIVNIITEILYGENRYQNKQSMKILVCAPSNAAVDELVLRLLAIRGSIENRDHRFKMVRIGRLDAMNPAVKSISVTELAKRDVDKAITDALAIRTNAEIIIKQKEDLLNRINELKVKYQSETSVGGRQSLLRKMINLRARVDLLSSVRITTDVDQKLHERLRQAAENTILAGADIIACTLSSCYTNQMESIFGKYDEKISVCIVDEATQSSEPETLIPLMLGVTTLVLVGDPNQLPATVISQEAKRLGFDTSLFARIQSVLEQKPHNPVILLDTQYRMADPIAKFPNRYFYKNALQSNPRIDRLPFHFYKVVNLASRQDNNKFSNTDEAVFVANLIYTMVVYSNLSLINKIGIGIITPYKNQREIINRKLEERMTDVPDEIKKKVVTEVNTVDSFQGQERDVIIMSCVRSDGIGFLSDRQRLCVALTRAKHTLILCGNFKTFEKDSMWFELLKDARNRNAYINIHYKAEPNQIREFMLR